MSHFDIQAEAVYLLKQHFPFVLGEYRWKNPRGGKNAVFDIVVKNEAGKLLAVIEIKPRESKNPDRPLKQVLRYQRLVRCPVVLIRGIDQARNAVNMVNEAIFNWEAMLCR